MAAAAEKVVVAVVETSAASDETIRVAGLHARFLSARLVVCQVADPRMAAEAVTEASATLIERTQRVTGLELGSFAAFVQRGEAPVVVAEVADGYEPTLLAIDDGRGTTAQQLLRTVRCAVLVVRPRFGMRVLVATDLSEPSLPAIEQARAKRDVAMSP